MLVASLLALGAGVAFSGAGYLFGARRGREARAELRSHNEVLDGTVKALEAQARSHAERERELVAEQSAARESQLEAAMRSLSEQVQRQGRTHTPNEAELREVRAVRDELGKLAHAVQLREREQETLTKTLEARLTALASKATDPEKLRAELQRVVSPLLQREHDVKGLQEMMRTALTPLVERDRFGRELAGVDVGTGLAAMQGTLDVIAEKGGFSAVVLADESGLPLGASAHTQGAEALAGRAALLHTLSERAVRDGQARPLAVVVHDESGQTTLHRIFSVEDKRYMLTAVAHGTQLEPDALDPALVKLERVLARPALWS